VTAGQAPHQAPDPRSAGANRRPIPRLGRTVAVDSYLAPFGDQVVAVNPNAEQVEGDRCYPDLRSIPGGVEAVVIGTRPEIAAMTMQECAELGIKYVWMHRGPGAGSVSAAPPSTGGRRASG
jgi:uncharacterized protein